jgi:hypothetical protein
MQASPPGCCKGVKHTVPADNGQPQENKQTPLVRIDLVSHF